MTQSELRDALKKNALSNVFLFCGEEDYLKQYYQKELRKSILTDDTLAVFNHTVLEGESIDFSVLTDAVSTPPFMADFKMIEWHLAVIDKMKEEELCALEALAAEVRAAGDACVLLSVAGDAFDVGRLPKKPSPLYTRLSKSLSVVHFPLSSDGELAAWIARHFKHESLDVSSDVCRRLVLRCGHSMHVLSGEIDKLVCLCKAHGRSCVTVEDVDACAAPCEEYDAFGLSNALLSGDTEGAYRNLRDLRLRRVEPLSVLGSLVKFYSELVLICRLRDDGMTSTEMARVLKMHEYPLKLRLQALEGRTAEESATALATLQRMDTASKAGGNADVFGGIERMIAATARPTRQYERRPQ